MRKTHPTEAAPAPLRVAYHAGPPEISFAGLEWRRGVAKPIDLLAWSAMQAREDFAPFEFRPADATGDVPAPPDVTTTAIPDQE